MTRSRLARTALLILLTAGLAGAARWIVAWMNRPKATASSAQGTMEGMAGMNASGQGSVRLTSAQIRQFGITFGMVEVRPLTIETRTTGTVAFDERRLAQVASKIGGAVERLYVNFTGQPVRQGDPLLELYSPDLLAAQQELLLAEQLQRDMGPTAVPGVPAASTSLVVAARQRLQLLDISDAQIDELLRSRRVLRTLTLHAPASGVVVEKKVVQGQTIVAGQQLYTVADLSEVWIEVQLRGEDAATVRVGSPARIEIAGMPAHDFTARIAFVYPVLDTMSRTVHARIVIENASHALKPGMYATVRLATTGRSALTVPDAAVLRAGDRNVVFVDMGNGELMPHEVELGRTASAYTEVLAGLEPGQRVVTSAQFLLDSESNLGDVMKAMTGQMNAGDMGAMKAVPAMEKTPTGATQQKGADMKAMPGMKKPPDRR